MKSEYVAFRATSEQREKLEAIATENSASMGWVLRSLVDRAELVSPAKFALGEKSAQQSEPQYQGGDHG